MRPLMESCYECQALYGCYYTDFKRCPKIEMAAEGLGIPCKPKEDKPYFRNVPFGVFMTLKHILKRVVNSKLVRSPIINTRGMDTDGDKIFGGNTNDNKNNSTKVG